MQYLKNINNTTITDFQRYKTWDNIFERSDVNIIFNNFLNTNLRIFYSRFIKKQVTFNHKYNPWITIGIRILSNKKRQLYLKYRVSNDNNLKLYYKWYCKILSEVSKAAEKLHYDKMILNSKSNLETMWKIIKTGTGKTNHKLWIQSLKINDMIMDNHIMIAYTFNKYFISAADSIISSVKSGNSDHASNRNLIKYLFNSFKHPFPNIQWFYVSTGEIPKTKNFVVTVKSLLNSKNWCSFYHFPFNTYL